MILVDQQNFTINLTTKLLTIYSKWPLESGLVSQGIAIESKGFLFKPNQALCQAQESDLFATLLVTIWSKTDKKE